MIRVFVSCLLAVAGAASTSVAAEESDPGSTAAPSQCSPEHAAMGHCTSDADEAAASPRSTAHTASPPLEATADYADRIWGRDAMAPARDALYREHGGGMFSMVRVEQAEIRLGNGHEGYAWDADAWFGGDINRLVLKWEGEGEFGGSPDIELTALYSRAIDPYFNLQGGLRQDIGPGPSRTYVVAGVEGLAPYWLEVGGYLYLSTKGELTAEASAEYDLRLTQRLILQPKIELALSAQDIPEIGIGAGLSSAEIGLRLRYEIAREFAPYLGVVHERKIGRTADFARDAGAGSHATTFVAGIRLWF